MMRAIACLHPKPAVCKDKETLILQSAIPANQTLKEIYSLHIAFALQAKYRFLQPMDCDHACFKFLSSAALMLSKFHRCSRRCETALNHGQDQYWP